MDRTAGSLLSLLAPGSCYLLLELTARSLRSLLFFIIISHVTACKQWLKHKCFIIICNIMHIYKAFKVAQNVYFCTFAQILNHSGAALVFFRKPQPYFLAMISVCMLYHLLGLTSLLYSIHLHCIPSDLILASLNRRGITAKQLY